MVVPGFGVRVEKDWIDILSALLTPTVAVFGVLFAGIQCVIYHKQLKVIRFDKRFRVYDAIGKYLGDVLTSGCVEKDAELRFLTDTKNAFFLFGPDVKAFIHEIFKKSGKLHALIAMEHGLSGENLEKNIGKQQEIKDWFDKELRGLQERFEKHLCL